MPQISPPSIRTHADPKAYLRALGGAPTPPRHGEGSRQLQEFARHWTSSPPEGLEPSDLTSLAWYHQDADAFDCWSALASPSVHLLLVMSLHSSLADNAAMFQAWPQIKSGLMAASLAPWSNCILSTAIGCSAFPATKSLLKDISVNAPIPSCNQDIQHWLWSLDQGSEPRLDYTRPLHHALCSKDFQTAQWLLDHDADPWSYDSEQRNALHALDDRIEQSRSLNQILNRADDQASLARWRDRLFSRMQGEVMELGTSTKLENDAPISRF